MEASGGGNEPWVEASVGKSAGNHDPCEDMSRYAGHVREKMIAKQLFFCSLTCQMTFAKQNVAQNK